MNKIDTLESDFRELVIQVIDKATEATGHAWLITSGRRTMAEQSKLYNQPHDGIDNDGDGRVDEADEKVTNAKQGQSAHNFGLAADLVPVRDGKLWWNAPDKVWKTMADIAVSLGLTSGYYFKSIHDAPHIEHPRWKEVQSAWKAGKVVVK